MKRVIRASSDYRKFDGYSLDEVREFYPEYQSWPVDYSRAKEIYIPRNRNNAYIGVKYRDGFRLVGDGEEFPVSFSLMSDYLSV